MLFGPGLETDRAVRRSWVARLSSLETEALPCCVGKKQLSKTAFVIKMAYGKSQCLRKI